MSTWGREKFTSGWNNPGHFQYDSADLPFSGEAGYLESGMPLWKINSLTEMEKSFCGGPDNTSSAAKDQSVSPLVKITTAANSRSQEDVSSAAPLPQRHLSADEKRRLSQSLPATPLSTPFSTPAQTPYSTPAPTPQSSPLIQRKTEMDAVCKAAARCNQRLVAAEPAPQNIKWFYMGFLSQTANIGRTLETIGDQSKELSNCKDSANTPDPARDGVRINPAGGKSEAAPRPFLHRCAPLMSNRDMNFLAPTSM